MNPYRTAPGSDPPQLAGRDEELEQADQAISLVRAGGAPRPIVLTGLRGMGKTALLRRFERAAKHEGAIVIAAEATTRGSLGATLRVGLESARREATPISSKLKRAVDAVLSALPEASYELPDRLGSVSFKTTAPKEQERLSAALDAFNIAVRKHGRWLTIGIDEVQQADSVTLDSLISTIHQSAGTDEPILFLGAGLRNAKAHLKDVRTYTERWRYLELGLLSLAQTMDAIQEPARKHGHPFTPDALERVAKASMGYPFFVQEFASTVWSRLDTSRKNISLHDVNAIMPHVQRELDREFYSDPLKRLTPRELSYVIAMARLGDGEKTTGEIAAELNITTQSASSTRQQLIRKDIIYAPDKGVVEFRVPLMARFVIKHSRELSEVVARR